IAIHDGEGADPRPGQRRDVKTSQRAAAHHRRMRPQQGLLSLFPDAWKQDLPRIALALGRVHEPDGNKVAMNHLRYHELGAIAARLLSLRGSLPGGCAAWNSFGAIPEV